jgi:Ca2+-binding EF-hand superfamily protein
MEKEIDKSEYHSAFQMLDKDKTGEITADRINDVLKALVGNDAKIDESCKDKKYKFNDFISELVNCSLKDEEHEQSLLFAFYLFDKEKYLNQYRKGYLEDKDIIQAYTALGQHITEEEAKSNL